MTQRFGKGLKTPSQVRARENTQPTSAQLNALVVFYKLGEKLGRCPKRSELAEAMGVTDAGAGKHLQQLTDKGLLEEEKELVVVGRRLTENGKAWIKQMQKSGS